MQSFDIPLHDIKPLIEVEEYSQYYLLGLVGLSLLLFGGITYLLYKWYKKSKIVSTRVKHKKLIDSINTDDTKNAAYAMSSYGITFKYDSLKHEEIYNKLSQKLLEYKYKKSVEKFDKETLLIIDEYKGMISVR